MSGDPSDLEQRIRRLEHDRLDGRINAVRQVAGKLAQDLTMHRRSAATRADRPGDTCTITRTFEVSGWDEFGPAPGVQVTVRSGTTVGAGTVLAQDSTDADGKVTLQITQDGTLIQANWTAEHPRLESRSGTINTPNCGSSATIFVFMDDAAEGFAGVIGCPIPVSETLFAEYEYGVMELTFVPGTSFDNGWWEGCEVHEIPHAVTDCDGDDPDAECMVRIRFHQNRIASVRWFSGCEVPGPRFQRPSASDCNTAINQLVNGSNVSFTCESHNSTFEAVRSFTGAPVFADGTDTITITETDPS